MIDSGQPPQRMTTLVVVGGGIAGLAAANRLREMAPETRLIILEAGKCLGGLLRTRREDGFVMEEAAEYFLTQVPWAVDLCRRIDFDQQLQATDPKHRGALVVRNGRLQPIPGGFALLAPTRAWPILTSRVLSLRGKLRLAIEPVVRAKRDGSDESIASFVRRRLGREVYERLVEPLVGSIYGVNPDQLSLAATAPQFAQMERTCGSLWRAQARQQKQPVRKSAMASRAPREPFAAPCGGMSSLVDAIAARLGSAVQLNSPVSQVRRANDEHWIIDIGGREPRRILADGVVVAAPAFHCAQLLRELDGPLADELSRIDYRDVTLTTVAYRREQIAHPLNSHGIVIPHIENRRLLSISFSSIKYHGRAPEGTVLLRVSLRPDGEMPPADLADHQLQSIVDAELAQLLGIRGSPVFFRVVRHRRALPIYRIGHQQRIERVKQRMARHRGLALAGAAYTGSGVPHCIRSGEQAAQEIITIFRTDSPSRSEQQHKTLALTS